MIFIACGEVPFGLRPHHPGNPLDTEEFVGFRCTQPNLRFASIFGNSKPNSC